MSIAARFSLLICTVALAGAVIFNTPLGASGGGGGGGGDEFSRTSKTPAKTKAKPSSKPKAKKKSGAKKKSAPKKKSSAKAAAPVAVANAKSVGAAVKRANDSTDRCVRYNKTSGSRQKCLTRMMNQFGKDLTANAAELPKKTPATPKTVVKMAKDVAKAKTKEVALSAIDQARSAFAVSMELTAEEDPGGEQKHAEKLEQIKGALENAYEALVAAS